MKYASLGLALIALAACNTDRSTAPRADDARLSRSEDAGVFGDADKDSDNDPDASEGSGVVYVLGNQAAANAVLAYRRSSSGALTPAGSYPTGGTGTGAGLGSQNALAFSNDGELLFAVNAGSNSVSTFRVGDQGLQLVSTASSGGIRPISLTAHHGVLYVLNDGGNGNIAGLRYSESGQLTPIANSSRPLSSSASAPAQIEFTPDGDRLIVTEKGTNVIGSYDVAANGVAGLPTFTPSSGQTPFGFAFRRNVLIVSEAFGGAANASAASSYRVGGAGPLSVISGSVPTTETAACWFVVTGNGHFAYAANTGSGTITGYRVSNNGALTRLVANGESAILGAGTAPADVAVSRNSRFLYARNGGNRTISAVKVSSDGSLTVLSGGITGLPAGTVGLLAR